MAYRIRVKSSSRDDLILVGSLKEGGAITTLDRHRDRQLSLAVLNPDGTVFRLRKQIGTRQDIELGARIHAPRRKPEPFEGLCNGLDAMAGDVPPIPPL